MKWRSIAAVVLALVAVFGACFAPVANAQLSSCEEGCWYAPDFEFYRNTTAGWECYTDRGDILYLEGWDLGASLSGSGFATYLYSHYDNCEEGCDPTGGPSLSDYRKTTGGMTGYRIAWTIIGYSGCSSS